MHTGLEVQQVSHYHGLGKILKVALWARVAGQVQVETSHRIRRVCGHGWQPWGYEEEG